MTQPTFSELLEAAAAKQRRVILEALDAGECTAAAARRLIAAGTEVARLCSAFIAEATTQCKRLEAEVAQVRSPLLPLVRQRDSC